MDNYVVHFHSPFSTKFIKYLLLVAHISGKFAHTNASANGGGTEFPQELRARGLGYMILVSFSKIIQAHKLQIVNRYELADFLNVTEDFLDEALEGYKSK